jgi:hypothetical protein
MASDFAEVKKTLQSLMPSLSADGHSFQQLFGKDNFQKNYDAVMARFDAAIDNGLDIAAAKQKASELLLGLRDGVEENIRLVKEGKIAADDISHLDHVRKSMTEHYNQTVDGILDLVSNAKELVGKQNLSEQVRNLTVTGNAVAAQYLQGAKAIVDELRSHSTVRGQEKEQLIEAIAKEIERRGIASNIRIDKAELNGMANRLWKKFLDKDPEMDLDAMMNPGSLKREVKEAVNEFFQAAEYEGKKANVKDVFASVPLGDHAGRIAAGVAGVVLMGVADNWANRIKKKNHAAIMLAEAKGEEVPKAQLTGTVFKSGAAVALGVVGSVGMFDALVNGPISRAMQNFVTRGR